MGKIGEDPTLKAALEKARTRTRLPSASDIPRQMALALVESCRQGTAPVQGVLVLSVGREDLFDSMRHDLTLVANRGSCLRVINGIVGMGKTLALRILQEFAHKEGFASSFLTLSTRECPIYDLSAIYRHIVKAIRVAGYVDGSALEQILESWAIRVKEDATRQRL